MMGGSQKKRARTSSRLASRRETRSATPAQLQQSTENERVASAEVCSHVSQQMNRKTALSCSHCAAKLCPECVDSHKAVIRDQISEISHKIKNELEVVEAVLADKAAVDKAYVTERVKAVHEERLEQFHSIIRNSGMKPSTEDVDLEELCTIQSRMLGDLKRFISAKGQVLCEQITVERMPGDPATGHESKAENFSEADATSTDGLTPGLETPDSLQSLRSSQPVETLAESKEDSDGDFKSEPISAEPITLEQAIEDMNVPVFEAHLQFVDLSDTDSSLLRACILATSTKHSSLGLIKAIAKRFPSVIDKFKDASSARLIHRSSRAGYIDIVEFLLDFDPENASSPGQYRQTPLHYAAQRNRVDIMRLLVERGASLMAADEDGYLPIHVAIGAGDECVDVAKAILDLDGDLIEAISPDGYNPREMAIAFKQPKLVELFNSYKNDSNVTSQRRQLNSAEG